MNNRTTLLSKSSIAIEGADATVRRLVGEVMAMDSNFPSEPDMEPERCVAWVGEMREVLVFCDRAEEGFAYVKAVDLALVCKRWGSLPQDFRDKYNDEFYVYATRQTGKARGTIENHIRAAETWVFKGVRPSGKIEIPVRDDHRKIIIEDGRPKTYAVEFDPFRVPIGKLILLRSKAEAGAMTTKDWAMLVDPGVSWDQLNNTLQGGEGGEGGGELKGIIYRFEGPHLVAIEYGQSAVIAEFDWKEYFDNPDGLERRAINRLCLILGINLDEKIIEARENELESLRQELENDHSQG